MVTTLLLLTAVAVIGSLGWGVLRRERVDETERFHRASEITSSWAAPGPRFQTVAADCLAAEVLAAQSLATQSRAAQSRPAQSRPAQSRPAQSERTERGD